MFVRLRHRPSVTFGELTGHAERAFTGTSSSSAVALVDALWESGSAKTLTIHDRDRILAAVWSQVASDRIASTSTCSNCGDKFDYDFSLRQFVDHYGQDSEASIQLPNATVTLPTGEDELALVQTSPSDPADWMRERCVEGALSAEEFFSVVDHYAPALSDSISGSCPECSAPYNLRFDVQTFVLEGLANRRRLLRYEIHQIASTYRWSLDEILSLSSVERRAFVELIEAGA